MVQPRVSIVVPAFNREQFVGRTLESVLRQTVSAWELVAVDDGSTDGTAAVVTDLAESDSRIRLVSMPNGGVARARNRGWEVTDDRTDFIIFLDSDDCWLPDALECMIAVLDERPDLVSVYGLAQCIDAHDRPIPGDDMSDRMRERHEYRGRRLVDVEPHEPTTFAGLVYHNYAATPGIHLVRRRVAESVGPFDPDTDPADDWDMAIRGAAATAR